MNELINGETKVYALLGYPVGHSRSPKMYNLSFANDGINAVYVAFAVQKEEMETALTAFRTLDISGGNVTMPGKGAAAELVDVLSAEAKLCGAVNTIVNQDGILHGYNTDGKGFVRNLKEHEVEIADQNLVLVGAGGAATAVAVQSALDGAATITVFNRPGKNFEHMQNVLSNLSQCTETKLAIYDFSDLNHFYTAIQNSTLLVNATSVGMEPHPEKSIIEDTTCFHANLVVCDLIYNPLKTKLLKQAEEAAVKAVIGGVGMLLYQGVEAYRLFTGKEMDVEQIKRKVYADLYYPLN